MSENAWGVWDTHLKNSLSMEQIFKSKASYIWSRALHLFSLVPCASIFLKEHCVDDGVIVCCSLAVYFLSSKRLVDNKYSRNIFKKNWKQFFFLFEICCTHPCFKEKPSSKIKAGMDPKMLATELFHYFFKREFFLQRGFLSLLFLVIFIVHQIFIILAKLKQGWDKIA